MKIDPVKYMRDFYPADMRLRMWIEDCWRQASERAGFEPWDAPIVEHLDLYKRKSGDEIVSQLYTILDRGGRELAIRPEMTPSLARMIVQKQAALPRPIKWFCIARMCRYERGQRGRLREFWQWNADVLGVEGPVADAEVINVAIDGLELCGLNAEDIEVRINSRTLFAALLTAIGVPANRHFQVYAVADKRGKAPEETIEKMYEEVGLPANVLDRVKELMACGSLDDVQKMVDARGLAGCEPSMKELRDLFAYLEALGKSAYCRFDIGIVRGLAYYTGPVFEAFDRASELRALCGGGRYDRLMETMGGQSMSAVGFGMGDVVLAELLEEKKKLPVLSGGVDWQVIPLEEERMADALRVATQLRRKGWRADAAMKAGGLGKAMRRAGEAGVKHVALVGGREWEMGKVKCRDMGTGEEREVGVEELPAK